LDLSAVKNPVNHEKRLSDSDEGYEPGKNLRGARRIWGHNERIPDGQHGKT
jgi:hypothetical protein